MSSELFTNPNYNRIKFYIAQAHPCSCSPEWWTTGRSWAVVLTEFGEPTSYSEVPSSTSSATTAAPKNEDIVVEICPLVLATARETGEHACKQKKELVT